VLLDSGVSSQKVRHKHLGELGLVVKYAQDGRLPPTKSDRSVRF
jgi:hypothetical protein